VSIIKKLWGMKSSVTPNKKVILIGAEICVEAKNHYHRYIKIPPGFLFFRFKKSEYHLNIVRHNNL